MILNFAYVSFSCHGVVSVAGNVYGSEISKMIKAFVAGDVEQPPNCIKNYCLYLNHVHYY